MSDYMLVYLQEKCLEQKIEILTLKELLRDAANSIESWGSYADKYFQEKWDLEGDIKRYRDAGEC